MGVADPSISRALPGATVLATAQIKLYSASEYGAWDSMNIQGAGVVASKGGTHFIHLVDGGKVLMTQELYENFEYQTLLPWFHSFEADDFIIGLSFASESDADTWDHAVRQSSAAPAPAPQLPARAKPSLPPIPPLQSMHPVPPPPPSHTAHGGYEDPAHEPNFPSGTNFPAVPAYPVPTPTAPPVQQPQQQQPPTPQPTPAAQPAPAKKHGGLFGSLASKLHDVFGKQEEFVVSGPRNFRHVSHIGWDPEDGFNIRDIPAEWRKLFQAAGIKKSELKDKETAQYVMNIIGETLGGGATSEPEPEAVDYQAPQEVYQQVEQTVPYQEPPPAASRPPPPPPPVGMKPPPPPPPPGPPAPSTIPGPPPIRPAKVAPAPAGPARGGLLDDIKKGKSLKHVDAENVPDISKLNANQEQTLTNTLMNAMAMRRAAFQKDDEEEEDGGDTWSDD
eukprot:TRINITY_DN3720_c0_g1_i2.p1 TRINITY_DN3720_c0_g1~~TRINITY_DN3720_c0_g1_i2.p1  ORF type:complete len:458 (+),score=146.49 TRINITY_DN3720_c0_g1_i2:32-1375(+)